MVISAKMNSKSISGNFSFISNWISCSGVSAWSTTTTLEGLYEATFLTISLPIEPAPPVTRTDLFS